MKNWTLRSEVLAMLEDRLRIAFAQQFPVFALRNLARDLVSEGFPKHEINSAYLEELIRFVATNNENAEAYHDIRDTLELIWLWTSEFNPEYPDTFWARGGQTRTENEEARLLNAHSCIQSIIAARTPKSQN